MESECKIDCFRNKHWFLKGSNIRHREDGPAIEYANGRRDWFLNGKVHRLDAPAVEHINGYHCWYLDGIQYDKIPERMPLNLFLSYCKWKYKKEKNT